jgi:hypothetical protein
MAAPFMLAPPHDPRRRKPLPRVTGRVQEFRNLFGAEVIAHTGALLKGFFEELPAVKAPIETAYSNSWAAIRPTFRAELIITASAI